MLVSGQKGLHNSRGTSGRGGFAQTTIYMSFGDLCYHYIQEAFQLFTPSTATKVGTQYFLVLTNRTLRHS